MPPYQQPSQAWLGQQLAAMQQQIQQLKTQHTTYVIDGNSVCQAIIGNLQYDNAGNATGLGNVWGLASFKTGVWIRL